MTIESLPGPGRLPMVVNGRNFPAIVEKDPGSSSRKGGDVDESSPTRISRTEMVARVLGREPPRVDLRRVGGL